MQHGEVKRFAEDFCQIQADIRMAGKTDESRWWLDRNEKDWWSRKDCYDFDVVYYVERGQFLLRVNGTAYTICQGDMVYLPKGMALEYAILEDKPLVKYYVHFHARMGGFRPITTFGPENILELSDSFLTQQFQTLCCGTYRNPEDMFRLHGALMNILNIFFSNYVQKGSSAEYDGDDPIADSFTYLSTHYREKISIELLAKRSGYSRDHYSKKFVARYGDSPASYLTKLRIRHAKELLTVSQLTVSQVAEAVGISDSNYFSRLFKRMVGLYPKKYRFMYQMSQLDTTKKYPESK